MQPLTTMLLSIAAYTLAPVTVPDGLRYLSATTRVPAIAPRSEMFWAVRRSLNATPVSITSPTRTSRTSSPPAISGRT